MEQISECRIPLLWNANGSIEVIQYDDVSPEEAKKIIQLFEESEERNLNSNIYVDGPLPKSTAPSPSPSLDLNSEGEYQDKMTSFDDIPFNSFTLEEKIKNYCVHENSKVVMIENSIPKNEKIYACHICGKKFSRKFNLNTHIKCVHSDEKDYVCPLCKRAFNHSSNLRKHIKTVHGENEKRLCVYCRKPFRNRDALKNHLKTIHEKVI